MDTGWTPQLASHLIICRSQKGIWAGLVMNQGKSNTSSREIPSWIFFIYEGRDFGVIFVHPQTIIFGIVFQYEVLVMIQTQIQVCLVLSFKWDYLYRNILSMLWRERHFVVPDRKAVSTSNLNFWNLPWGPVSWLCSWFTCLTDSISGY